MRVTLPYNWRARGYQGEFFKAMESGTRFAVAVWHRRCGKDLSALNFGAMKAGQRVGAYWHVLPNLKQGRRIVWDGMTKDGRRFLDHFPGWSDAGEPGSFVTRTRDDEMKLWLANGSTYQILGAEDPDSLVGANPIGIIFSEFSIYDSQALWDLMKPVLEENGGWAVFIFTPRGKNHGWKLLQDAKKSDRWFAQVLTIDDTRNEQGLPLITNEQIQLLRDEGMPEHKIEQEFYCSFEAPLEGAFYGDRIRDMERDGRIRSVPWEPKAPVNTMWDLGIRGRLACSIWFHQLVHGEHRLIDFETSSEVGLDYYVSKIRDRPYVYGKHLVPHDAEAREIGSGDTRIETARQLGLRMTVVKDIGLQDGINAVRNLLPKVYIDETKCEKGVEALKGYVRTKMADLVDADGNPLFSDVPVHDWNSHPSDALRIGAVGLDLVSLYGGLGNPDQQTNPTLPIV